MNSSMELKKRKTIAITGDEYHAGAAAAGVFMGLTVPTVLSSRAEARLAGLAVAALGAPRGKPSARALS